MELISSRLLKYQYFAKPEGQDPVNKIMGLLKVGLPTGLILGVYDACLYSKPKNFLQFLNTTGYWVVPISGMCITFSSITYVATKLRKKDDTFNYILGVLASSYVLQTWQKNLPLTGLATCVLSYYAFVKKNGTFSVHPNQPPHKNTVIPSSKVSKWYAPWRNVPYRNYTLPSKFPIDKSYYKDF